MVELWGLSTGSSKTDIILGQGDNGNIVSFDMGVSVPVICVGCAGSD
jgi:hypothetical protein